MSLAEIAPAVNEASGEQEVSLADQLSSARTRWAQLSAKRQRRTGDFRGIRAIHGYNAAEEEYNRLVIANAREDLRDELVAIEDPTERNKAAIAYWLEEQNKLRYEGKQTIEGKRTWKFASGISKWLNSGSLAKRVGKGILVGAAAGVAGSALGAATGAAALATATVVTARYARGWVGRHRGAMDQLSDADRLSEGVDETMSADEVLETVHANSMGVYESDSKMEQKGNRRTVVIALGSVALGSTVGHFAGEAFQHVSFLPSAHAEGLSGVQQPHVSGGVITEAHPSMGVTDAHSAAEIAPTQASAGVTSDHASALSVFENSPLTDQPHVSTGVTGEHTPSGIASNHASSTGLSEYSPVLDQAHASAGITGDYAPSAGVTSGAAPAAGVFETSPVSQPHFSGDVGGTHAPAGIATDHTSAPGVSEANTTTDTAHPATGVSNGSTPAELATSHSPSNGVEQFTSDTSGTHASAGVTDQSAPSRGVIDLHSNSQGLASPHPSTGITSDHLPSHSVNGADHQPTSGGTTDGGDSARSLESEKVELHQPFTIEHGHGYTNELIDAAKANGVKLSPQQAWQLHVELVNKFGEDYINLGDHTGADVYSMGSSPYEVGISAPSHDATWSPKAADYIAEKLHEMQAGSAPSTPDVSHAATTVSSSYDGMSDAQIIDASHLQGLEHASSDANLSQTSWPEMKTGVDKLIGDIRANNYSDVSSSKTVQYFLERAGQYDLAGIKYPGTNVYVLSAPGANGTSNWGLNPAPAGSRIPSELLTMLDSYRQSVYALAA